MPGTSSLMMDWTKVYIDASGQRFVNEQTHYAIATNAVVAADTLGDCGFLEANQALVEAPEGALPPVRR